MTTTLTDLVAAPSLIGFTRASETVVEYLKASLPLGFWSVNRYDGASQVILTVADDTYGLEQGLAFPWEDTLCQYSVDGRAPHIAPDVSAVPLYARAGAVQKLPISSYVGIPIVKADGSLFGSLCGIDPQRQPAELTRHEPLLRLLSGLLSNILEADLYRLEAARLLERAETLAETDPMTGLCNRRGWTQFMDREEERYRRYGDPAAVIIIDLDGLKSANDRLGHAAGDELICRAAATLSGVVRTADLAARLGGDEFGVIATPATGPQAGHLTERIRAAFEMAGIAASVGCAPFRFQGGFAAAWEEADAAMYADKRCKQATCS